MSMNKDRQRRAWFPYYEVRAQIKQGSKWVKSKTRFQMQNRGRGPCVMIVRDPACAVSKKILSKKFSSKNLCYSEKA